MPRLRAALLLLAALAPLSVARADEAPVPPPTLDQVQAHIKAGLYWLATGELRQLEPTMTPADRVKSLPAVAAIVKKFPAILWLYDRYKDVSLDDPAIDAPTREAVLLQLGMADAASPLAAEGTYYFGNPPPDRTKKLRRIPPGSPYRQRAQLLIAKEAVEAGRPDGALEPVRELLADPSRAAQGVRVLAEWRLDQNAFVDPHDMPHDTPSGPYKDLIARSAAELERIGKTKNPVADSARFHVELFRLKNTVFDMRLVPGIELEQVVIATVCTSGSTPDVLPKIGATIRATRDFMKRVWVSDDYADLEGQLRSTREQASTDAGAAVVWLAVTSPNVDSLAPEIDELTAWYAEARRELEIVKPGTLDEQEITVQQSVLGGEIARAYREKLYHLSSKLDAIDRFLASAARNYRAMESKPLLIAAGTAGLEVALSSCPGEQASRTMSRADAPATRAHGCAGCATSGSSSGWLALGVLLVLRRRRRV